jgi:hypothetical protein
MGRVLFKTKRNNSSRVNEFRGDCPQPRPTREEGRETHKLCVDVKTRAIFEEREEQFEWKWEGGFLYMVSIRSLLSLLNHKVSPVCSPRQA